MGLKLGVNAEQSLMRLPLAATLLFVAVVLTWVLAKHHGERWNWFLLACLMLWHVSLGGGLGAIFGKTWKAIGISLLSVIFTGVAYFGESAMRR